MDGCLDLLHQLPEESPSESFEWNLKRRIMQEKARSSRAGTASPWTEGRWGLKFAAGTAAAAVVVIAGFWLFTRTPEKTDDPQNTISDQAILDLTPMVREVLLIDMPIQPTCKPDCAGLCPICGENRNEVECSHPEAEIDPRMAVLKTLISKS